MITHVIVIGYPHSSKKIPALSGPSADLLRQGHQIGQVRTPQVLDAIWQQQHPFW